VAATEKKYWADPFATAFETRGALATTWEGKPSVVLRETIFYPEGGGQLGDLGELHVGSSIVKVTDTQIDDAGTIHHIVDREVTAGDDVIVTGSIDVARRRDHMAQHTAQHMLSRALLDEAKAATVSARLGTTSCTIDVDRDAISDVYLHRAEDLVNDVIRSDVNVRAHTFKFIPPSATVQSKVPNACNTCHKDKDTNWAATQLASWTDHSIWRMRQ